MAWYRVGMKSLLYPKHRDGRTTIHRGAYNSWRAMKERCYGKKYWARKHYSGKGITVCDRWRIGPDGFANFLADMGDRPDGMSLDRIDNSKGYCPENCRWADQKQQVRNSSRVTNAIITQDELANAKVSMSSVYCRIRKGWSKEAALNTPGQQWKRTKVYGPCPICGATWERRGAKFCCREHYIAWVKTRPRGKENRFLKGGGSNEKKGKEKI